MELGVVGRTLDDRVVHQMRNVPRDRAQQLHRPILFEAAAEKHAAASGQQLEEQRRDGQIETDVHRIVRAVGGPVFI